MNMIPVPAHIEKKKLVRTDSQYVILLRKLMSLADGRSLLTITKEGESIDVTVLELGKVERIK